jgi:hypothetical protein
MSITISGLKLAGDGTDKTAPGHLTWTGAPQNDWLDLKPQELEREICSFLEQQVHY